MPQRKKDKYTCKVLSRSWERSRGQARRWEVRQGRAASGGGGGGESRD